MSVQNSGTEKCPFRRVILAGGGLGGFLTGQLHARAGLSLADSFIVMGAAISFLGVITRIAYKYCGGQSSEQKLVAYKNELMQEEAEGLEMEEVKQPEGN